MAALEIFHKDDEGYRDWLDLHELGYVLNAPGPGLKQRIMLHTSRCGHLYEPDPAVQHTIKRRKVCSDNRSLIDDWAKAQKYDYDLCPDCEV
jgi:hypothetical protein